jgi:hypothetical protein
MMSPHPDMIKRIIFLCLPSATTITITPFSKQFSIASLHPQAFPGSFSTIFLSFSSNNKILLAQGCKLAIENC